MLRSSAWRARRQISVFIFIAFEVTFGRSPARERRERKDTSVMANERYDAINRFVCRKETFNIDSRDKFFFHKARRRGKKFLLLARFLIFAIARSSTVIFS